MRVTREGTLEYFAEHHQKDKMIEAFKKRSKEEGQSKSRGNSQKSTSIQQDLNNALMVASIKGYGDIVKELLNMGADVHTRDEYQKSTPLMLAAKCNCPTSNYISLLIEHGSEIEAKDKFGDTPLLMAVENCNMSCVRSLIEHNANVGIRNKSGQTCLMLAAETGSPALVRLFLHDKCEVNETSTTKNDTALHHALYYNAWKQNNPNRLEVIGMLLDAGSDASLKDKYGNTPLEAVMEIILYDNKRYHGLFNVVREWEDESDKQREVELIEDVLKTLISRSKPGHVFDKDGNTVLHVLARTSYTKLIQDVINMGHPVNALNYSSRTPTDYALKEHNKMTLKLLLENGGKTNAVDFIPNLRVSMFLDLVRHRCDIFQENIIKIVMETRIPMLFIELLYHYEICSRHFLIHLVDIVARDHKLYSIDIPTMERYLELFFLPPSLLSLARSTIIKNCDNIEKLTLPTSLKLFLKFQHKDVTQFNETLDSEIERTKPKFETMPYWYAYR